MTRTKDTLFIVRKIICMLEQFYSIYYEICQAVFQGKGYCENFWNYAEILEFGVFTTGAVLDIYFDEVSDPVRILLVCSVQLSLFKFLNLTRCFTSLSFLVQMLTTVFNDITYFLLLFLIFLLTFAMCIHVLAVDAGAYGRVPPIFAQVMAELRASMGDMAMLDPYMSFDLYDGPDGISTPFPERKF